MRWRYIAWGLVAVLAVLVAVAIVLQIRIDARVALLEERAADLKEKTSEADLALRDVQETARYTAGVGSDLSMHLASAAPVEDARAPGLVSPSEPCEEQIHEACTWATMCVHEHLADRPFGEHRGRDRSLWLAEHCAREAMVSTHDFWKTPDGGRSECRTEFVYRSLMGQCLQDFAQSGDD